MAGIVFSKACHEQLETILNAPGNDGMEVEIANQLVVACNHAEHLDLMFTAVDIHQNCNNVVLYLDESSDIISAVDVRLIREQLHKQYRHKLILIEA